MKQQVQGSDTVVLGSEFNDARALTAALVDRLEHSLADGKLELPSLPEVALKVRRALADENVSVSEIARLLGTDPALAARTLRIANSAMFYRGSRPITSLNGAVSQLGHKMGFPRRLAAQRRQALHLDGREGQRGGAGERRRLPVRAVGLAPARRQSRHRGVGVVGRARARRRRPLELQPGSAGPADEMTAVVAVANYLVEHSEAACADAEFHAKAPTFGSLSMDKSTFDWLVRAADVDVRLMTLAFGV